MKVAVRYSVRDNIMAAILFGLLLDIGRITATDLSQIIDPRLPLLLTNYIRN